MVRSLWTAWMLLAVVFVSSNASSQQPPSVTTHPTTTAPAATQPTSSPAQNAALIRQIQQAIKDLSSDSQKAREAAAETLWKFGTAAVPELRKAAAGTDAEARTRAAQILERFKWGDLPGLPDDVLSLARENAQAQPQDHAAFTGQLIEMGDKATPVLVAIARQKMPGCADKIFAKASSNMREGLLTLAKDKPDLPALEAALKLGVALDAEDVCRTYVALCYDRGTLDAAIASHNADDNPVLMIYLHRAKGDLPAAARIARESRPEMYAHLLIEQGNWKELLACTKGNFVNGVDLDGYMVSYQRQGLRATCYRLLGQLDEMQKALKPFRDGAVKDEDVLEALFTNDDIDGAMAHMLKEKQYKALAEIYAAQSDNASAIKTIDEHKKEYERANNSNTPPPGDGTSTEDAALADRLQGEMLDMAILKAGILGNNGQRDKAKEILAAELAKVLSSNDDTRPQHLLELMRAHKAVGLNDEAWDIGMRLLERASENNPEMLGAKGQPCGCFEGLFPDKDAEAFYLARLLREKFPDKKLPELVDMLAPVLGPNPQKAAVQTMVGYLSPKGLAAMLDKAPEDSIIYLCATGNQLAFACFGVGLADQGQQYLDVVSARLNAGKDNKALEYGSWLLRWNIASNYRGRGKWDLAIHQYAMIPQAYRSQQVVFAQALCCKEAGKTGEAARLMDQAELMTVGDEDQRRQLAEEMISRGMTDRGVRLMDSLLKAGWVGGYVTNNVLQSQRDRLALAGNSAEAVRAAERNRVFLLNNRIMIAQDYFHLQNIAIAHLQYARTALAKGDPAGACEHALLAQKAAPGDADLVIDLVAKLDKLNRRDLADKLYAASRDFHQRQVSALPDSARALNSMAWMQARCRRDLGKAIVTAQKAVKIDPSPNVMDTLAEAYFQAGQKDKALEIIKEALKKTPKDDERTNKYLKSQQQRMEKGDTKTDPLAM